VNTITLNQQSSFLGVSLSTQNLIIKKINPVEQLLPYVYFKIKSDWIYIHTLPSRRDVTPDVTSVTLCAVSKIFNPERYQSLLAILIEQYLSSGDPTKILEGTIPSLLVQI
jgi:hypothetical protein